MRLLITGGAGFIGSALVRHLLAHSDYEIVNVDVLTYAADATSAYRLDANPRYRLESVDIRNRAKLARVFREHRPHGVMHLAAESHVDRSIDGPDEFVQTNIVGTYNLLEVSRAYLGNAPENVRRRFRFQHVSTDEVYGSLEGAGPALETSAYAPNSPYAASKASSNHLVRAWHQTYGLPILCTNCSNNYGPYQFPEKLIPLMIRNALVGRPLPIYGDGLNTRDWIYVDDHAAALHTVFEHGRIGETYNIGGFNECTNLDIVRTLCEELDRLAPDPEIGRRRERIEFVTDRKGHDRRHAVDASKIQHELGWHPEQTLQSGIGKTVRWYLDNQVWLDAIAQRGYDSQRLGLRN